MSSHARSRSPARHGSRFGDTQRHGGGSDSDDDDEPGLRLNHVEVSRRIKDWLSQHVERCVVEYDETSVDTVALRFEVHSGDPGRPLDIQPELLRSARKLGAGFSVRAEDGYLVVTARQPTASEARRLMQGLRMRAGILAKSVWRIDVVAVLMLLSLMLLAYAMSKLHDHWHGYDSPWETLFHWVGVLAIACGNKMRERWPF